MELKFLGRGSGSNTKDGSNAAYLLEGNQLLLIDCGESVLARLNELGLLESVKELDILITHTHSDHVGSLGNLILAFHTHPGSQKSRLVLPKDTAYRQRIEKLLGIFGCTKDMYEIADEESLDEKYRSFRTLRYRPTHHTETMPCFSLWFETDDGTVYYSGDSDDERAIQNLVRDGFAKMYVDVNEHPDSKHLYLNRLAKLIPDQDMRSRTYCMHLSSDRCLETAQHLGLSVVEVL